VLWILFNTPSAVQVIMSDSLDLFQTFFHGWSRMLTRIMRDNCSAELQAY